jgi:hypothetical protein
MSAKTELTLSMGQGKVNQMIDEVGAKAQESALIRRWRFRLERSACQFASDEQKLLLRWRANLPAHRFTPAEEVATLGDSRFAAGVAAGGG